MTTRPGLLTGTLALFGAMVACHRSSVAPSPTAGAGVVRLAIQGPATIAPGQTAAFTAIATMSDRSVQDYTTKVVWTSIPTDVVTVQRDNGNATAGTTGDAQIFASLSCCRAAASVIVLPPNTFRLTGNVLESGSAVQGASVAVVSGIGSGLTATTDYAGQYRLYGVAGPVALQMSKPGYVDIVKSITLSQNDVLDFPEARQVQPLPMLAGAYVLALEPDAACPHSSSPGLQPLPADLLQMRSYQVQVSQQGPTLHVTGAPPAFLPPSDSFDGRITPDGIAFELGDGYVGYGPQDGFTAILSMATLTYEGSVSAALSGHAIVGSLNGVLELFTFTPPHELGNCIGNHRFTMSPVSAGALR